MQLFFKLCFSDLSTYKQTNEDGNKKHFTNLQFKTSRKTTDIITADKWTNQSETETINKFCLVNLRSGSGVASLIKDENWKLIRTLTTDENLRKFVFKTGSSERCRCDLRSVNLKHELTPTPETCHSCNVQFVLRGGLQGQLHSEQNILTLIGQTDRCVYAPPPARQRLFSRLFTLGVQVCVSKSRCA